MKQKYKNLSELWHAPGTNDLFIIIRISTTIEFLSSLRSFFQLHAIKSRIKTTTEKSKGMKLKFYSKYFYENIKVSIV